MHPCDTPIDMMALCLAVAAVIAVLASIVEVARTLVRWFGHLRLVRNLWWRVLFRLHRKERRRRRFARLIRRVYLPTFERELSKDSVLMEVVQRRRRAMEMRDSLYP